MAKWLTLLWRINAGKSNLVLPVGTVQDSDRVPISNAHDMPINGYGLTCNGNPKSEQCNQTHCFIVRDAVDYFYRRIRQTEVF
jgi:hypothetical protein